MNIPRYWARAGGDTPPDYEGSGHITVWGWSADSRADAERHARQRLTVGWRRVHDEASDVIHPHDAKTRADARLPLA